MEQTLRSLYLILESPETEKIKKLEIKLTDHPLCDRLLLCLEAGKNEYAYIYTRENLKDGNRISPYKTTPYSFINILSESLLSLDNDIYDLTVTNEKFGDVFLAFAWFEDNHPFETFLKERPFNSELPTHVNLHLGISWAPEYSKENKPLEWLWWFNDLALLKKKFRNYLRRSEGQLNSDAYKFGRIKIGSIDKISFGSKTYKEIYKNLEKYNLIKGIEIEQYEEDKVA